MFGRCRDVSLKSKGAFWIDRVRLGGWRRSEEAGILLRVSHSGRTGRTTAQPPPAPRGVGAREGACEALGLMHPACLVAIAAVRDGGDQNYLPPRRPGDPISGEAAGASGQSHIGRLQKCSQEAKLQILLQIHGRWLRVTEMCLTWRRCSTLWVSIYCDSIYTNFLLRPAGLSSVCRCLVVDYLLATSVRLLC